MSLWKCKTDDGELEPVSFQELAEMLREGKIGPGALVCREGASKWEPAWHVPGLLNAAGMAEPGDSIQSPKSRIENAQAALTPALSRRERGDGAAASRRPMTLAELVRAVVAAAVGVLAVGFFYRWASQAALAFPMPSTVVDGETIDCTFPLVGRCTMLECGLLYVDVFALAALATWYAAGKRGDGRR